MQATVVCAFFSTEEEDPTELLLHLLHRRVVDLCPQPERGLQFIAWCLQQSTNEQKSGVCIWARAAPPQRPRMSTWQKIFPGAVIQPMQAQQWLRTLTSRAQHSGLFCSPATVHVFSAYEGVAGGTPVLNIEQHIQDISPQLQSPATRTPVDLRPSSTPGSSPQAHLPFRVQRLVQAVHGAEQLPPATPLHHDDSELASAAQHNDMTTRAIAANRMRRTSRIVDPAFTIGDAWRVYIWPGAHMKVPPPDVALAALALGGRDVQKICASASSRWPSCTAAAADLHDALGRASSAFGARSPSILGSLGGHRGAPQITNLKLQPSTWDALGKVGLRAGDYVVAATRVCVVEPSACTHMMSSKRLCLSRGNGISHMSLVPQIRHVPTRRCVPAGNGPADTTSGGTCFRFAGVPGASSKRKAPSPQPGASSKRQAPLPQLAKVHGAASQPRAPRKEPEVDMVREMWGHLGLSSATLRFQGSFARVPS